jgi:hypothetical protein
VIEQIRVTREKGPLAAMRAAGLRADDFPERYRTAAIDRARMRELGAYGGLLWIEDGEVVASGEVFATDVTVADATRGEGTIGRLRKAGGREMARRLIEAEIIRTYWHLEAVVNLEAETAGKDGWEGSYRGRHVYYTNDRNVRPFAFRVKMGAGGTVAVAYLELE